MMYAHCFPDHLAFFADAFSREAPAESHFMVSGREFVSGHPLAAILRLFADARGIGDHRAAVTDWSKFFFARLIVPTVMIQAATARPLDLASSHWCIHFRNDGTISRFVFDRDPLMAEGASIGMASLIDDVVAPLITVLVAECRLSPRVFASNAAMYFAWAVDQLDPGCGGSHTGQNQAARTLLGSPRRPGDGGYNPFYAPFKSLPPGALDGRGNPIQRCRKLCCVRDLDPSLDLCVNCPRAVTYGRSDHEAGAVPCQP